MHKLTIKEDDENANSNEKALERIMRNYNDASLTRTHDQSSSFTTSYNNQSMTNSMSSERAGLVQSKDVHIQESYSYQCYSQATVQNLTNNQDYVMYSSMDERLSAHGADVSQRIAELPNEDEVNQSWSKMVSAAEKSNGDYLDLLSLMDDGHEEVQNSSLEMENNMDGSSVGQLSNMASSGYQSFGYSQSSSPIDPLVQQHDVTRSPSLATTPLSFSNPLFRHSNQSTPIQQQRSQSLLKRTSSCSSLSDEEENDSQINMNINQRVIPQSQTNSTSHPLRKLSRESSSSGDSLSGTPVSSRRHSSTPIHARPHTTHIKTPQHAASSPNLHRMRGSPHLELYTIDSDRENSMLETNSLSNNELSRSAEFTPNKRRSPFKRNSTDGSMVSNQMAGSHLVHDLCYTPPGSPCYSPVAIGLYGVKKSAAPQNTVRMGIRSVQRKIQEQEKSKSEVSREI